MSNIWKITLYFDTFQFIVKIYDFELVVGVVVVVVLVVWYWKYTATSREIYHTLTSSKTGNYRSTSSSNYFWKRSKWRESRIGTFSASIWYFFRHFLPLLCVTAPIPVIDVGSPWQNLQVPQFSIPSKVFPESTTPL